MKTTNKLRGPSDRTPRPFLRLCWLPLFAVVSWSGCNQHTKVAADNKTVAEAPADINPVGTYALVSVDGSKVPCTVEHEGHTMTINSGAFVINADGTCLSRIALAGRPEAIEVKATYTREGPKLTMTWQGAGMTLGTVAGDTFTMNNEGMVFVYRK